VCNRPFCSTCKQANFVLPTPIALVARFRESWHHALNGQDHDAVGKLVAEGHGPVDKGGRVTVGPNQLRGYAQAEEERRAFREFPIK
jgi:hypothetical protein